MQSNQFNLRIRQVITLGLTVIGLLLFVFGSSRAISQSNDKQYVEGKQREQQLRASKLTVVEAGGSYNLANTVNPFYQDESVKPMDSNINKPDNSAAPGHFNNGSSESRTGKDSTQNNESKANAKQLKARR